MPNKLITYTYKDLAACLVRDQNIHEGHWEIYVRFGLNASNVIINEETVMPTAIVPLREIGIANVEKQTPMSVDASKINPHSGKAGGDKK